MLELSGIPNVDVVEPAPSLGRTPGRILELTPSSYTGADSDPDAVAAVRRVFGLRAKLIEADAAETGLADESADLVIGKRCSPCRVRRLRMQSLQRLRASYVRVGGTPFTNWGSSGTSPSS